MNIHFFNVKWGRVLLTGLVVSTLSFLVIIFVIFIYALILGFQARGAPDQARIEQFADLIGALGGAILPILLTLGASAIVARKVKVAIILHGALVGLVVAIIGLIITLISDNVFGLMDLMWFVLTIGAGILGGFLGSRGK